MMSVISNVADAFFLKNKFCVTVQLTIKVAGTSHMYSPIMSHNVT